MHAGYRRRPGLVEQWRSYGHRPFAARWVARSSLLLGVAFAVLVILAVAVLAVSCLWHMWLWLWTNA